MNEEEIVVDSSDTLDSGNTLLLEAGASDEENLSYSTCNVLSVEDVDIYQSAFIGFGVVGSACLMCYGMILIIHLFRKVM